MRGRRALLPTALGAALLAAACGGGDSTPGSGDGELAGAWRRTAEGTGDTCGTGGEGMTMDGILQVTHIDTSLTVEYRDICGQPPAVYGAGSYTGSVVMVSAILGSICRDVTMVGRCCYDAEQTDTGTLQGDSLVGETVIALTLDPSQSHPLCEPACEVSGTLEWERCPPADCAFQVCGPASPAP